MPPCCLALSNGLHAALLRDLGALEAAVDSFLLVPIGSDECVARPVGIEAEVILQKPAGHEELQDLVIPGPVEPDGCGNVLSPEALVHPSSDELRPPVITGPGTEAGRRRMILGRGLASLDHVPFDVHVP